MKNFTLAVQFVGWFGLFTFLFRTAAPAFEVHGTIRYESYLAGVTNLAITKEFKVEVNGCDWLIRTSVPGDCSYNEKAFHNGNLFNLNLFCASSTGRSSNTYVGLVESDELPDDDGSQINYLWLAYASACHLNNEGRDVLRPICCLDDRELRTDKFKMRSILTRAEAEPRVPIWLAYLSDGLYRVNQDGKRSSFKVPQPFDQGYTNAVFSVVALTNCGALQLPLEFAFTRFAVSRDPTNRAGLWIRTRIVGKATMIAERHSSPNLLPQFSGEFTVMDNRFKSANPPVGQLHYRIRDGEWANEINAAAAKVEEINQQIYRENAIRMVAKSNHFTNSK